MSKEIKTIPFDSLYYYIENGVCLVICPQFKSYYKEKKVFNQCQITGRTINNDTYQIGTDDLDKLAKIFSFIFNEDISPDQVKEHSKDPTQSSICKTSSSPTSKPEPVSGLSNSKLLPDSNTTPKQVTVSQQASIQASTNKPIPASLTNSAPVINTTTELGTKKIFPFESLFYYKKDKSYYIASSEFRKQYQDKKLFSKYNVFVKTVNKDLCQACTDDATVLSHIFCDIFQATITPDQIIEHTKKDPDTYPPIPAEKKVSAPINKSNAQTSESIATKKFSSTPFSQAKESSPIPAAQTSSTEKITDYGPDTILITKSQFEKLCQLLGAPPWMAPNKFVKLSFKVNK